MAQKSITRFLRYSVVYQVELLNFNNTVVLSIIKKSDRWYCWNYPILTIASWCYWNPKIQLDKQHHGVKIEYHLEFCMNQKSNVSSHVKCIEISKRNEISNRPSECCILTLIPSFYETLNIESNNCQFRVLILPESKLVRNIIFQRKGFDTLHRSKKNLIYFWPAKK